MKDKLQKVNYFGIRHLSPISGHFLIQYLNQVKPQVVLIEGMEDASIQIETILNQHNQLPISLLAYTETEQIDAIFFPLAEYSPEYQGLKWANDNQKISQFIDLSSSQIFQNNPNFKEAQHRYTNDNILINSTVDDYRSRVNHLYNYIANKYGEENFDIYWESEFEQLTDLDIYQLKINTLSFQIREYLEQYQKVENPDEYKYNLLRETHMQNHIIKYLEEGYNPEQIVVVCGAYHLSALKTLKETKTDYENNEQLATKISLIPYSYKNLSTLEGYGAGNIAPNYYQLLWEDLSNGENLAAIKYITAVASHQREKLVDTSTASVLEAINLSYTLARLRTRNSPTLNELYDSAVTTLADGRENNVIASLKAVDITDCVGYVHTTLAMSSIQADFHMQIEKLKLTKYLTSESRLIRLDVREDYTKSEEKFRDLKRAILFNRLKILNVSFCQKQTREKMSIYFELWTLKWNPQIEIELIENIIYGHSIETATKNRIQEQLDTANTMLDVINIIENCYQADILEVFNEGYALLDKLLIENDNYEETIQVLIVTLRIYNYKSSRTVDKSKLEKLIIKLYNKSVILLYNVSNYSQQEIESNIDYIVELYYITKKYEHLIDSNLLYTQVNRLAYELDNKPMFSAICLNILIQENYLSQADLTKEVNYRISSNQSKEDIVNWFYGLCRVNRDIVLNNKQLWITIADYIDNLSDQQFIFILVAFRRTFALFTSRQKVRLYTILAKQYKTDPLILEHQVDELMDEDKQLLKTVNKFDFGDLL